MKKYLNILLFITPFIIGITGFIQAGIDFKDAAFNTLIMYFLNYGDSSLNIYIEIARWTAPIVTASGIIMTVAKYSSMIKNHIRYVIKKESIAVYGDTEEAVYLKEVLKDVLISPIDNKYVKASKYILCGNEFDNIKFYLRNKDLFNNSDVCIQIETMNEQEVISDHLKPFSLEESGSRLFWKSIDMCELSHRYDHQLNIAIIGDGKLAEQLVTNGLQLNIFSPKQQYTYTLYGDYDDFIKMHYQLDKISDRVIIHKDWKNHLNDLKQDHMIIVAKQENQLQLIQNLFFAINSNKLYVLENHNEMLTYYEKRNQIVNFNWFEKVLTKGVLFEEQLLDAAKKINLRYAHIYNNVEETKENMEKEWHLLNGFTKYSNISSADYHDVRLNMMNKLKLDVHISEDLELLAELEHMRWERFHYLSNWSYGCPANNKNKDTNLRIHIDLIPYQQLLDKDKQKDRDTIKLLLEINQ